MSGTNKQQTLAAPASVTVAPSAPSTSSGGNEKGTQAPAESAPTRTEEASSKSSKSNKATTTPRRVNTPAGPTPTVHLTQAELEEAMKEFEQGESAPASRVDPTKANAAAPSASAKAKATTDATRQDDALQKEIDDATAAAEKAGLEIAKPEAETTPSESELDKEPEGDDGDALNAFIGKLPKGAQTLIRRLQKQRSQQFVLNPTFESPLSGVENQEDLHAATKHWKTVMSEGLRVMREGFHEDGTAEITLPGGKKQTFKSEEELKQHLDFAERLLNEAPDWMQRLVERGKSAPWEKAERIAPGLFEDGSAAHKAALELLRAAPQLKSAFPDFEVRLAHYARSVQMESDAMPTTEFPQGKAKWVRLELDGEGRVKQPSRKTEVPVNTKPLTEKAPVVAPGSARPALRPAATKSAASVDEAIALAEKSHDPDDLAAAVRAFEKAA